MKNPYPLGAKRNFRLNYILPIYLLCTFLVCLRLPAQSNNPAPAVIHKDTTNSISVAELLRKNHEFYAGLKSFSVDLSVQLNIDQGTFKGSDSTSYSVFVQYPSRLNITLKEGSEGPTLVSDGSNILAYPANKKNYLLTTAPQSLADIDGVYLDDWTSRPNPFEFIKPCLSCTDCNVLKDAAATSKYIGRENLDGVFCHHFQFTRSKANCHVWIEDNVYPVTRRMSFDLSEMANQEMKKPGETEIHMELVVTYDHWRFNPDLSPEIFKLTVPPGATRLDSKTEPAIRKPVEEETLIGKPAPNFKLTLLDGGQIDLASHRNKEIVILEFWAGWSVPSMRALPELTKIAEANKNKSVIFYAINNGQSPDAVRTLISKLNPTPTVGLKPPSSMTEFFKVLSVPFYVIIDKQGIIRYQEEDYRYPNDLKQKLDALLAKEQASAKSLK
ncbi:DUF2092 domain-containing protein [Pedosphaera parvula]|uniref:DUF2092 domain-containing protein n=1 Tax=Pedosphaera parvula TaxID=1032527 RepID=UPI00135F1100|nr:DUF2092 domain-containing protein [Pedosphaera parvula]